MNLHKLGFVFSSHMSQPHACALACFRNPEDTYYNGTFCLPFEDTNQWTIRLVERTVVQVFVPSPELSQEQQKRQRIVQKRRADNRKVDFDTDRSLEGNLALLFTCMENHVPALVMFLDTFAWGSDDDKLEALVSFERILRSAHCTEYAKLNLFLLYCMKSCPSAVPIILKYYARLGPVFIEHFNNMLGRVGSERPTAVEVNKNARNVGLQKLKENLSVHLSTDKNKKDHIAEKKRKNLSCYRLSMDWKHFEDGVQAYKTAFRDYCKVLSDGTRKTQICSWALVSELKAPKDLGGELLRVFYTPKSFSELSPSARLSSRTKTGTMCSQFQRTNNDWVEHEVPASVEKISAREVTTDYLRDNKLPVRDNIHFKSTLQ
jgi:hypothetical protein